MKHLSICRAHSRLFALLLSLAILNIASQQGYEEEDSGSSCFASNEELARPSISLDPGSVKLLEGETAFLEGTFARFSDWTIDDDEEYLDWFFNSSSTDVKTVQIGVKRSEKPIEKGHNLCYPYCALGVDGSAVISATSNEDEERSSAVSLARAATAVLQPSTFQKALSSTRPLQTEVTLENRGAQQWDLEIVETSPFLTAQLSWDAATGIGQVGIQAQEGLLPACPQDPPCDVKGLVSYRATLGNQTIERVVDYIVWIN